MGKHSRRDLAAAQEYISVHGSEGASYWVESSSSSSSSTQGLCWTLSYPDLTLRPTGCRRARNLFALCQADPAEDLFQVEEPLLGHSKSDPGLHPLFGKRSKVKSGTKCTNIFLNIFLSLLGDSQTGGDKRGRGAILLHLSVSAGAKLA